MTTEAISGYGTTLQLSAGGSTPTYVGFIPIAEVRKISGIGIERDTLEATHLASPAQWREFIYGLLKNPDLTLEVNYIPQDTSQKDLITGISAASTILRGWRLVLPDFGATTKTLSGVLTTTATTSASHGWETGQSVKFSSTVTVPGNLVAGVVYWIRKLSSTTFSVHATPTGAGAGTGAISMTSGSGTITVSAGSSWTFVGECKGFSADPENGVVLSGQIQFAVSGASTPPA